jgi:hypothetical protein
VPEGAAVGPSTGAVVERAVALFEEAGGRCSFGLAKGTVESMSDMNRARHANEAR